MGKAIVMMTGGAAGLALLIGCAGSAQHPGRETYLRYCVMCHGPTGQADGPLAESLPVAPTDLGMLAAANNGVFPSEQVMATVHGYPGKHDAAVMPEFGPLLEGPKRIWVSPEGEEIMTPVALLDLTGYLETLQR